VNIQLRIERLFTWLAGGLATVVVLCPPAAYFFWSYQQLTGALENEVAVTATAITDFINLRVLIEDRCYQEVCELWQGVRLQRILLTYQYLILCYI
jgi:hypothetical protein